MNILIIGNGGREHAIAWAVRQSPNCTNLYCANGNAGIEQIAECVAINPADPHGDHSEIIQFCTAKQIDFVIIGPEAPLVAGLADALSNAGITVFGPSAQAAMLEGSKAFTKQICTAVNAPTAKSASFNDLAPARAYLQSQGAPIVIKDDGLAAGKGVVVAETMEQALAALDAIFADGKACVLIEEFMAGEEASLFVLCDGKTALPFGSAQDHKRAYDGDKGPNTGGMGAYSPAPVLSPEVLQQAMDEIIHPTLAEMRRRGTPYHGVLYAGLMIADGRARLVEYNVRFGDPECQVLMMRLGGQVLDALYACAVGRLGSVRLDWAAGAALCVVYAAAGYPGDYDVGDEIKGVSRGSDSGDLQVFHAGTRLEDGVLRSAGGRVLGVTAVGADLAEARVRAYGAIEQVDWDGGFYRRDIGSD